MAQFDLLGLREIRRTAPPMYGTDIMSWQRLLTDREFPLGEIDGFFGPRSEAALLAFQEAYGLEPDGVLGATSAKALIEGFPQPVD